MPQPASAVVPPPSPTLSASRLGTLIELGEERTADVGDVLYRVGDRDYPFMAIVEGQVAILDAAGNEIVRHGAGPTRAHATTKRVLHAWRSGGVPVADRVSPAEGPAVMLSQDLQGRHRQPAARRPGPRHLQQPLRIGHWRARWATM